MTDTRPLLLLDVDGPLNPWRADPCDGPAGYGSYDMRPTGWEPPRPPLRVLLNVGHGPRLLALACRLVWATTWEAQANTWIAPVLGLPELPFVPLPRPQPRPQPRPGDGGSEGESGRVHWKTRILMEWADGRPFAWVDDEITDADRACVARHYHGEAHLHRVDPAKGLLPADFATLGVWAERAAA